MLLKSWGWKETGPSCPQTEFQSQSGPDPSSGDGPRLGSGTGLGPAPGERVKVLNSDPCRGHINEVCVTTT